MTGRKNGKPFILILLTVLLLAMGMSAASADDEELLRELPGVWHCTDISEGGEAVSAVLTLERDGTMCLRIDGTNGEALYSYDGVWSLELTTEMSPEHGLNDRLTFHFTATDNPQHAGKAYDVECVYYAYSESWVEKDTRYTYLIRMADSFSGVSPFAEIFGEDDFTDLYRKEGPNRKVVNCKNYVSLREERSKSSRRLAKVPLGALVFAFPEDVEENGFIRCVYHDEYGFILSEYLQPIP